MSLRVILKLSGTFIFWNIVNGLSNAEVKEEPNSSYFVVEKNNI